MCLMAPGLQGAAAALWRARATDAVGELDQCKVCCVDVVVMPDHAGDSEPTIRSTVLLVDRQALEPRCDAQDTEPGNDWIF